MASIRRSLPLLGPDRSRASKPENLRRTDALDLRPPTSASVGALADSITKTAAYIEAQPAERDGEQGHKRDNGAEIESYTGLAEAGGNRTHRRKY